MKKVYSYENLLKNQLKKINESNPEDVLESDQKKGLSKIIQEIKQKTQSLKDKRKNVKYKLDILYKPVEPICNYGVKYLEYLDTLSEFDRMYIEGINLVNEISDLTKEIDRVGNVILYLRGDKWRV